MVKTDPNIQGGLGGPTLARIEYNVSVVQDDGTNICNADRNIV